MMIKDDLGDSAWGRSPASLLKQLPVNKAKLVEKARDRWDNYFLNVALLTADMSKDPRTKVGAAIVNGDKQIISTGFNGFSRGVKDTEERLNSEEVKHELIIHAEMNAALAASRLGISVKGCSLYLIGRKACGDLWGLVPCTRCSVELIQAGISEIISINGEIYEKWKEDFICSEEILEEAGIKRRKIELGEIN